MPYLLSRATACFARLPAQCLCCHVHCQWLHGRLLTHAPLRAPARRPSLEQRTHGARGRNAVRRCEPRRRGRGGGERSGSCGRRVRVSCVRTESGVRSCFGRAPAGRRPSARRATARAARRCWRRVRGLAGASVRPRPSAPSRALFVASAGRGRQPTATGSSDRRRCRAGSFVCGTTTAIGTV